MKLIRIGSECDRYIVPAMSMDSLNMRLGRIVEKDWKSQAEALLEERKATGEGEVCFQHSADVYLTHCRLSYSRSRSKLQFLGIGGCSPPIVHNLAGLLPAFMVKR